MIFIYYTVEYYILLHVTYTVKYACWHIYMCNSWRTFWSCTLSSVSGAEVTGNMAQYDT